MLAQITNYGVATKKIVTHNHAASDRYDILTRAFQSARQDGFSATDEASMVERLDVDVTVVPGSDRNIKITKPTDMDLAHLFYREEHKEVR